MSLLAWKSWYLLTLNIMQIKSENTTKHCTVVFLNDSGKISTLKKMNRWLYMLISSVLEKLYVNELRFQKKCFYKANMQEWN